MAVLEPVLSSRLFDPQAFTVGRCRGIADWIITQARSENLVLLQIDLRGGRPIRHALNAKVDPVVFSVLNDNVHMERGRYFLQNSLNAVGVILVALIEHGHGILLSRKKVKSEGPS